MDLRHLRYFVTLAAERNFNRAADRLHMAQPPLSRAIQQLEEEVGAVLLDRSERPFRLTPIGQVFHSQAQGVLERAESMRSTLAAFAATKRRRFVIGFVASTIYARLPELIRAFRTTAPDVELVLVESPTLDQMLALKEGRIDIGFGRIRFDDPDIRRIVLRNERLVAALPVAHPLAMKETLSLQDFSAQPLIVYPREPRPSYADQVISILRDQAVEPRVAHEARELQTAIGLVAAEEGLAIVPESVRRARTGDVVYRDLEEAPTSPIILSHRRGSSSAELRIMSDIIVTSYAAWGYAVPEALFSESEMAD